MTVVQLIGIASLAGALLFFVAGAVTMFLVRPRTVVAAAAEPSSIEDGLADQAEAALAEVARLRGALATSDQRVREQQAMLDEQITIVKRDASETAAVAEEIARLTARAERAEGAARDLAARVERAEVAARELTARAERGEGAARELVPYRARAEAAESKLAPLRAELERVRNEATDARRELERLEAEARDVERVLSDKVEANRDLSTENEQLKGRMRDAEALRAEYVRLKTASLESEFLKSEVARLEKELRSAKVTALGAQRPRPARGTERQATSTSSTIGESLTNVIERFADAGTRSSAIGDALGFQLASTGTDGVALAAYAALLFESATRANQLLPVAAPAAIEIIDEHGARLSVWTFDVEGERLLLANLAVTPVDSKRVESTLADLAAILAPTPVRRGNYTTR